jgi:hypothetical protein
MRSIYSSNAIPKFEFSSKVVGYCFPFVTGRWHPKQKNANAKKYYLSNGRSWLQEQSGAKQDTPTEINNGFQSSTTTSLSSLVAKQAPAKQPPAKRQKLGPIARQNELLKLACDYLSKDSKLQG